MRARLASDRRRSALLARGGVVGSCASKPSGLEANGRGVSLYDRSGDEFGAPTLSANGSFAEIRRTSSSNLTLEEVASGNDYKPSAGTEKVNAPARGIPLCGENVWSRHDSGAGAGEAAVAPECGRDYPRPGQRTERPLPAGSPGNP